jgi:hypothetical protein
MQRLRRAALAPLVERRVAVLVEGERGVPTGAGLRWEGYTPGYHRVVIDAPATVDLANRIVDVAIERIGEDGGHLIGRVEDAAGPATR